MAAYNATSPAALAPGESITLSNASLGASVLTQQVGIGPVNGYNDVLTLFNYSAVALTVNVSPDDANQASYLPLKSTDGLVALTCAANSAISFTTSAAFVAIGVASDPGATNIILSR
jgi:hypothetical protein